MKSVWVGIGMSFVVSASSAACLSLPTQFLNADTKQTATVVACARPFNSVSYVAEKVRVQIGDKSYALSSKTDDKILVRLSKEFCHLFGSAEKERPFAFSGRIFGEKGPQELITLQSGYNPSATISAEAAKPLSHFFCTDVHK